MYSIGVDLGGTSCKVALVTESGQVLGEARHPTVRGDPLSAVFGRLHDAAIRLATARCLPYPPPGGIGVGVAGIVDPVSGRANLSGVFGLGDCNLRTAAETSFGAHVTIESDSNAGALADLYWGQARLARDVLYVVWGTGIGAGLVFDRRIYRSRGHGMGELGHIQVVGSRRRPCYCGCSGCLETEAGGRAIEEDVSRRLRRRVSCRDVGDRAAAGDAVCSQALERAARMLARGIAVALTLINPDCVVLGGGVSHAFPLVRASFEAELSLRVPAFSLQDVTVTLSDHPDRAGLLGAALLPRHEAEGKEPAHATARLRRD